TRNCSSAPVEFGTERLQEYAEGKEHSYGTKDIRQQRDCHYLRSSRPLTAATHSLHRFNFCCGNSSSLRHTTPLPRIEGASRSPRILLTSGAERKVFRSGSPAGREFASFIIVAQLDSRWRSAKSRFPNRLCSSAAVPCTRQWASGTSKPAIASKALVVRSWARANFCSAMAIRAFASKASALKVRSSEASVTLRNCSASTLAFSKSPLDSQTSVRVHCNGMRLYQSVIVGCLSISSLHFNKYSRARS